MPYGFVKVYNNNAEEKFNGLIIVKIHTTNISLDVVIWSTLITGHEVPTCHCAMTMID